MSRKAFVKAFAPRLPGRGAASHFCLTDLRRAVMTDLLALLPPAPPRPAPSIAGRPRATTRLDDPHAHRCFRCDAPTGLGLGLPHRGEPIVWACRAHIGELS